MPYIEPSERIHLFHYPLLWKGQSPTPKVRRMHYSSRASWMSLRRASRVCTCCLSASCALVRVLILTCSWKGTQVCTVRQYGLYLTARAAPAAFVLSHLRASKWQIVALRKSSELAGVTGISTPRCLWEPGPWKQCRASLHTELAWKLQKTFWYWVYESLIHSLEIAPERCTGAGVTFLNKQEDPSTFCSSAYFWLHSLHFTNSLLHNSS